MLWGTGLPSSELMLSTHTPDDGRLFPDHSVFWASKNSSSLVPVKVFPAEGRDEERPRFREMGREFGIAL